MLRSLKTHTEGLSSREAQRRLAQYGPNPLQRREGVQWPRELALPLTHSLAVLLWVAAPSFIVGSITVGVAVVLIIVLNAAGVFVQSATRRTRSRRSVGVFSNRYLLWAIAGELAIAAVFVFAPPCQALLGTAVLPARDMVLLILFPFIVWGADELRKWVIRSDPRGARRPSHDHPAG